MEVVPGHEELEIVVEFLDRSVNFGCESRDVELVEERLMKALTGAVGPWMSGFDERETDTE